MCPSYRGVRLKRSLYISCNVNGVRWIVFELWAIKDDINDILMSYNKAMVAVYFIYVT